MVPHYKDVPEAWREPFGPYVKAPAEFGGDWYYVSPFNPRPWETGPPVTNPPAEFVKVFGPRPGIRDAFYAEWNDNLKYFKGIKLPEYITKDQVDKANVIYQAWNMGNAVIYEGRYGYSARFPEAGMYEFDIDARTAVDYPHYVVALFQVRLAQGGQPPAKWHPFVPPQFYGGENPKP